MQIAQMTWPEVAAHIKRRPYLILPVGTCEQHGAHLPLNTDILTAEYFAGTLSRKYDLLVAPTFNYGVNLPCDRDYSGTNSLTPDTITTALSEMLQWWKEQGFRHFFILSAHGDPWHISALKKIESAPVHVIELFTVPMNDILEKQHAMQHACEAETSVMLYLFPNQVHLDKALDFTLPPEQILALLNRTNTDPIAGCPGSLGFPTWAAKHKGEKIVRRVETFCENAVSAVINS